MFRERSTRPERIDTGDYTHEEYERFLDEIGIVNRYAGDSRALKKAFFREIEADPVAGFSVLDVGAGSGLLLRQTADFARKRNLQTKLVGLELNPISALSIAERSGGYEEISTVMGNVLALPFPDDSFDYVISSLVTHHLTDEQIIAALTEMHRVAGKATIVIDLHRHPLAYAGYKLFCGAFGISELVRHDGSLSILKGFRPEELRGYAERAGIENANVIRSFPFRLVLTA